MLGAHSAASRSILFSLALITGAAACHHNNGDGTTNGATTNGAATTPQGSVNPSPGTPGAMDANDPSMQNPNSSIGPHTPTPPANSPTGTTTGPTSGTNATPPLNPSPAPATQHH
ncbi:MAG TPA: hypothetical protein VGC42_16250 [Kofleriaceae bacterium]